MNDVLRGGKGARLAQQVRLQKKLRANHDSSSPMEGIAKKLHNSSSGLGLRRREEITHRKMGIIFANTQRTAGELEKDGCKY